MAVKIMRTDDDEKMEAAENEYKIQKSLKHPNIIGTVDLLRDAMRNTLYTVMEFAEGQQLQDYII